MSRIVLLLLANNFALYALISGAEAAAHLTNNSISVKNALGNASTNYSYYVSGFDYDGRPVVVVPWGKWSFKWLVEHPDEQEKFVRNFNEYVEEVRSGNLARSLSNGLTNGTEFEGEIVSIIDFDGMDVREVSSAAAIQLCIDCLKKFQEIRSRIAYSFIVYANSMVFQVVTIAKPLIGNTLERTEIFGTNSHKWIPRILRKIPRGSLPPAYGGSKDFKPVFVKSLL